MTATAPLAASAGAAEPPLFRPVVILTATGVAIAAAIAFIVLLTYAPDLRGGDDGGAHALSRSAVGYAGIVRLLREEGTPVLVSRGPPPRGGLLILTPGLSSKPEEIAKLYAHRGPVVEVLTKWQVAPDLQRPGWVSRIGLIPAELIDARLMKGAKLSRVSGPTAPVLQVGPEDGTFGDSKLAFGPVDSLQTRPPDQGDRTPTLVDQSGRPVLVRAKQGNVLTLNDPDLLNNHGLSSLQTARAAVAMLDVLRDGEPVIFDVTLNGFSRPRSLLRMAFEPPFLAATLTAFAAAALIGWRALVRFGPVRRPERAIALGKRALADNAAGLIRLARREPRMARRYAALTRGAIASGVGAPRDLAPEQTDALLDRLADPTRASRPFTDLVHAAELAGDEATLMRTTRALYELRLEMTRERG